MSESKILDLHGKPFVRTIDRQAEVMHDHYQGGFVTFVGGPPCVIVETDGDEALIKAIAEGYNTVAGQEFMVKKRDLIPAEVHFAGPAPVKPELPEPDWNQIIGREKEYSKNA